MLLRCDRGVWPFLSQCGAWCHILNGDAKALSFDMVWCSLHPAGVDGETPGKSSNENWAAR
eukprot:2944135-Rhodomonas_salina.5